MPGLGATVDFQRDILPLLADRCFLCHGPDAAANESGLRLDQRESAIAELPSGEGTAIVPGDPETSVLIARIASDDPETRMPPPAAHRRPLSSEEVQQIRRWIERGASYERHWALRSLPARVRIPKVRATSWPSGPLDAFVLAALEQRGWRPAPLAEKWRWLRRVTLDLTGVPPTPDEIRQWEQDQSPHAMERVVDRLLASPRFGQRMAVPWLDAVRYADSYGYQSDLLCQTWPYRDWVVQSFNANQSFREFATWQLAGDLLPDATQDQVIATAFHRLHRQTNEGGSIDEEWRTEYAADRAQTFGAVFLGLTVECARCHDHKFDPITMREFYQLTAFFNSIDEAGTYTDADHVPTPTHFHMDAAEQVRERELAEALTVARDQCQAAESHTHPSTAPWDDHDVPSPISQLDFNALDPQGQFANGIPEGKPATHSPANRLVPGHRGQALELTGDDPTQVQAISLAPWQPFAIGLWVHVPQDCHDGVIWQQEGGTDVGFHGTELSLQDDLPFFAMIHFWPGNAQAVRSRIPLPKERWVHVTANYDGSGQAAGMQLYIDGRSDTEVVRDGLQRSNAAGDTITLGQRFRSRGLAGGRIDDFQLYDRALSRLEVSWLMQPDSPSDISDADAEDLQDYYRRTIDPGLARLRQQRSDALKGLMTFRDGLTSVMVMDELPNPRPTYVLDRGRYDAPKAPDRLVSRDTPRALPPFPQREPRNRLGLARWLTERDHPLTARVAVNRLWQVFFGRGLVETSENFGVQGTPPSHPDLLDWLARDFVDHGWDVKRMCRQIVLSSTYRQTSAADQQARRSDPGNIWLARGPANRFSAEMLRDLALFSGGLLDDRLAGPPVGPYQPEGLWTENNSMTPEYRQSTAEGLYRRSLYSVWKRTAPLPNMVAFDAAGREVCTARRIPTSTPLQALVLLNDVQFVEAARVLAESTWRAVSGSDDARLDELFLRLAGRVPRPDERNALRALLAEQRLRYAQAPEEASRLLHVGQFPIQVDQPESIVELAAATVVAQAILNSDAAVWKR